MDVDIPSQVLPDPALLLPGHLIAVDTETSGLHPDSGATVSAVSVAFRTSQEPDIIEYYAFPFDQGRALDKGFTTHYYSATAQKHKRYLPKGSSLPVTSPDTFDPAHPLSDWDTDHNLPFSEYTHLLDWLAEAARSHGLVGQNVGFDTHFLHTPLRTAPRHRAPVALAPLPDLDPYVRWDTMLASRILEPLLPTGLKPTAARVFPDDPHVLDPQLRLQQALKVSRARYQLTAPDYPRYDLLPWDVLGPYAAQDALITLKLFEYQLATTSHDDAFHSQFAKDLELRATLHAIESRGLGPIDRPRFQYWAERLAQRLQELDAILPFSPPTIPQARNYFFSQQRATPWGPGDTPAPSLTPTLNLRVAARLQELGVPHADTWQEHQRIALALNNYFTTYPQLASPRDHKLRTTFRQAHVKSGRLSTERFQVHAMPKKLNLPPLNGQRIPELRTLILTPPGRTRYIVDLSQAELRIAASIAHCKPMFDLLSTPNGDVHSQAATQIFGITPTTTTPEDWKAKRDLAKRTVFGSLFGVGPKTFQASLYQATGIILPIEEVTEIINAFNRAYPHYRNEYYKWKAFVEKNGYVPLIDGSLSWFHPDRDWPRAGWNRRVQGSLAIYVREWLPAVDALSQGSLVGTVHDSAIFDLPTDEAPHILEAISEYTTRSWYDMFGIRGGCDATPW